MAAQRAARAVQVDKRHVTAELVPNKRSANAMGEFREWCSYRPDVSMRHVAA